MKEVLTFLCVLQDYPSVGQLLDILQDFDSFVIFAIQENKVQTYQVAMHVMSNKVAIMHLQNHAQNLADTILNANTPHASVLSFTIDSDDSGDTTTPQQILDQITGEYEVNNSIGQFVRWYT